MSKLAYFKQALLALLTLTFSIVVAEIAVGYLVPLRDVGPSFSRYDPLLGQSLRPNFSTVRTTPEFTMKLTTNSLGLRGPEPVSSIAGGILFLGDSFTMGYGVSDGEEFPALVAEQLRQPPIGVEIPVINAGIGNSGNGRWVKLLKLKGSTLAPRAVVMQVLENDFDDNTRERLFELAPSGTLLELPVPPPGLGRRFQAVIESIPGLASTNLIALLRQAQLPHFQSVPVAPSELRNRPIDAALGRDDILTLRIIERAVSICRDNGWPVLGLSVGLSGAHRGAIAKVFHEGGAELLEFPAKSERPDLYYKIDGHWNAAGHAEAAARVLDRLKQMGIVGF